MSDPKAQNTALLTSFCLFSNRLGLAVIILLLGHFAYGFGPPASHDDDVKRTSNSKWGKTYWEGRGDAGSITVELYQKEDDCKTGRITDTSGVRALFRSWWILNPNASERSAVQYEDEHTKEFHMQEGYPGHFQALLGMCEGEVKQARIPPTLMYSGTGLTTRTKEIVPRWATIIVHIEVLSVANDEEDVLAKSEKQAFSSIDADSDGKLSRTELSTYYKGDKQDIPEANLLVMEQVFRNDEDGDGLLTFEEFSRPLAAPSHGEL